MRLAIFVLGSIACGCVGTPTPLAPSVGGSIGVPHHGVQTGASELPVRGPGFRRLRPKSQNYWGNPRLVAAVEHAAKAVADARPGGAALLVGDVSAQDGGKVPGHHSHRTGRDVDLLYFTATPSGAAVESPGFIHFGSDGLAKIDENGDDYLRLDVERQWLLVRELLLSTDAEIQWMFASRNVEALLIDYARARDEDPALIWRAETVLLEPGDSTPHDDHIHVRIACSAEELLTGCEGGGPRWPWLSPAPELGELDGRSLEEIARDDPFELAAEADAPGGA